MIDLSGGFVQQPDRKRGVQHGKTDEHSGSWNRGKLQLHQMSDGKEIGKVFCDSYFDEIAK